MQYNGSMFVLILRRMDGQKGRDSRKDKTHSLRFVVVGGLIDQAEKVNTTKWPFLKLLFSECSTLSPVSTQRCFDVYLTSITFIWRWIDVVC